MTLEWENLDDRAVATARILAADSVEQIGSGHPGTAISLASAAYLIYQRHLRIDPNNDRWLGRDRFILSAGHASVLQYVQLYLADAGVKLDDLKKLRTWGSLTPGHPEFRHTKGIELTTGPLGTGVASAVGFAMSARHSHALYDPETPWETSVFDHHIYAVAGDGCMQEGVASEAASLAGNQKLGNLTVLYDDNHISIEDDTKIAFNEDVLARYESYGWDVHRVSWLHEDGSYHENLEALDAALTASREATEKPSIIALRTIIGWPTPGKSNTGAIHGAKLGSEALRGLKEVLGQEDPDAMFAVDQEAVDHSRENVARRAHAFRKDWDARFNVWRTSNPQYSAILDRVLEGKLPDRWEEALPIFEEGKAVSTRSASGQVLNAIADVLPELWGGSADLAGSNNTFMKAYPSFLPAENSSQAFPGSFDGRNLHFGVREFAMGAIMNGVAADGLTRIYGGTFFVFSDFMRGAVRLAALMQLPVVYVWTHDSIGVGEDGPTHQPVEHLTAYRAIPNLSIIRPCDAAETVESWKVILERQEPSALILSRQDLPNPARGTGTNLATIENVRRGAYVLSDSSDSPNSSPDVILMASGSEVPIALEAATLLRDEHLHVRVVSVPCMEWFAAQDQNYKESVLPRNSRARVSVEAGLALPWRPLIGDYGRSVSLEHFGASASADVLYEEFGITPAAVVDAAHDSLRAVQ